MKLVVASPEGYPVTLTLKEPSKIAAETILFYLLLSFEGSERRGLGSAFHQLCPRYSGTLTPTAPTAIWLWDTFTFTYLSKKIRLDVSCESSAAVVISIIWALKVSLKNNG